MATWNLHRGASLPPVRRLEWVELVVMLVLLALLLWLLASAPSGPAFPTEFEFSRLQSEVLNALGAPRP